MARNSLSIAAAKESNLFGGTSGGAASSSVSNVNSKSSPTESTWSFNPSGTSGSGGGGGGAGGMQNSGHYGGSNPKVPKNPWQDSGTPTMQPSDLAWDTGLGGGKARAGTMMGGGALGKQGGGKLVEANGWNTSTSAQGGSSWNSGTNSSWASTWILLRNLTAQVRQIVHVLGGFHVLFDFFLPIYFAIDRWINATYVVHATRSVAQLPTVYSPQCRAVQVCNTRGSSKSSAGIEQLSAG